MNLKNVKVVRSTFVGTGPSFYKKSIYRAAVSQRLRNTGDSELYGRVRTALIDVLAENARNK